MTDKHASEKEVTYCVEGMHCPNCELRIEKALRKLAGVTAVDADAGSGRVRIRFRGRLPAVPMLNELFREDQYVFSDGPVAVATAAQAGAVRSPGRLLAVALVSLGLIGAFALLGQSGLAGAVRVDARSSLPAFFVFGLLAGASSCAALVGGLVLSMSRQWLADYAGEPSWLGRSRPHLLFNLGRLIGFGALGMLLGAVGGRLRPSPTFSSLLVLLVSLLMVALGLQMLGVKGIAVRLPKGLTRLAADESRFRGRHMPFVLGALTFLLPCGFTLTAQSVALLSSSPVQGGLIMLFFALGTLPMLLTIGLGSTGLLSHRGAAQVFMPVAGVLVLFFAVYNLNSQMNVLGLPSVSDLAWRPSQPASAAGQRAGPTLPTPADGKQLIQMEASAYGYSPRWFRVKAGVPVRWEITDTGTSGCTNAVISPRLFADAIELTTGTTSVKEFTPRQPGAYKFSCWMGMVWGVIEVIN